VILQTEVIQLSTDFRRIVSEVSSLRSAAAGIQSHLKDVSALKAQIVQKLKDSVVEQFSTEFGEL
jgi:hypothetical protein